LWLIGGWFVVFKFGSLQNRSAIVAFDCARAWPKCFDATRRKLIAFALDKTESWQNNFAPQGQKIFLRQPTNHETHRGLLRLE
jgi:hypothetical protein